MLASIHPLGERSRQNQWAMTVGSFTIGSVLGAAATAAVVGWVGSLALTGLSVEIKLVALGLALATSAVLDARRVRPPGPERQVNESWIGAFRGWIYGGAFGVQLGTGVVTYVVTWSVYATVGSYLLLASPRSALIVGVTFGLGRSISVLAAGYVDRPSRLTLFNRKLAELGPRVALGTAASMGLISIAAFALGTL